MNEDELMMAVKAVEKHPDDLAGAVDEFDKILSDSNKRI